MKNEEQKKKVKKTLRVRERCDENIEDQNNS